MQHMACVGQKTGLRLLALLNDNLSMITHALSRLGDPTAKGLDPAMTKLFNYALVSALRDCRQSTLRPPTSLCNVDTPVLDLWRRTAQDPDWAVIEWLYTGAPAGLLKPVEDCSIFPPYDPALDVAELNVEDLATQPAFANYNWVESCAEVTEEMDRLSPVVTSSVSIPWRKPKAMTEARSF